MIKRYFIAISFCILSGVVFAQTGSLKGKVTDSAGSSVEGSTIQIENTKYVALTDNKGNYKIDNVPVGSYSVIVQIVGYNPMEEKATVTENQTTELDFKLLQKINQLGKVDIVRPLIISQQGMGHMPEAYDGVIYSGMKTEVLVLDSVDANKAQNNPRETLGRLPGSNYSETEGGGFPSNGIAFRGLIPTQSIEIQTRQNGYNLSGDVYGYPESYYLPPLVAVSRIELINGESSLQFGPQFGGVINYVLKDGAPDKPWEFGIEQTGASYDFVSTVLTGGGTYKKWHYFAFAQYKATDGWRPNSDVRQATAFAKVEYDASEKFKISMEYTLLRNLIHMPGGLTDAEFDQNPDQSFRARNWLSSPWNLLALTATYKMSENSTLVLKSVVNNSARNLVWKNEDGGPQVADSISPITNTYVPREVEHEGFLSITNELRLLTVWNIGKVSSTLAAGIRYFQGNMVRQEQGPGSTGSDFDMNLYGSNPIFGNSLFFTTGNVAPFVENTFHFGRLSVTPGFRFEYINSTARGYITPDSTGVPLNVSVSRTWMIPLGGCALQFKTSPFTNIYGNIVQAYEPTTYENLTPIGTTTVIDPNLKDVNGYNSDFGWRGKAGKFINFDVGVFYMVFNDEIGLETLVNPADNTSYQYRTNVGDAVHKGIETYIELHIFRLFSPEAKIGDFSFFNSYAYDQSRYVSGPYTGNYEEQAPVNIERLGVNYSYKTFSTTVIYSYSSQSFGDANNTIYSPSAIVGLIPAYTVMDWSSTLRIKNYDIKFGISNLANAKYFNLRTDEYPGPGIIPAPGRNFYVGISAQF
jgi:Fe(3+) dicitrate transport protein